MAAGQEVLDIETLRLAHAEVEKSMDRILEETSKTHAEYAALPTAAGGVITLFIAFRPDDLSDVFPYLYFLGLVPLLLIVYISLVARHNIDSPKVYAEMADQKIPNDLLGEDRLDAREWLRARIIGLRTARAAGLVVLANHRRYVRTARVCFAVLVVYLAAVTVAALLVK